jgi:hypothetical protein
MFHEADGSDDLLANWRWLLGAHDHLLGWSSSGDLFVSDRRHAVSRLDIGAGTLEPVAPSVEALHLALEDPRKAEDLLLLSVVRHFEQQHGILRAGECLGFTMLPVFGGTYTVENRSRLLMREYAAFTGDIHSQIRDSPDGSRVSIKIVP